jgi:hypothetical protein
MPISPDLIVFAVRSLLKVGGAVDSALQQAIRDDDLKAPHLTVVTPSKPDTVWEAYRTVDSLKRRVAAGGDLEQFWDPDAKNGAGGPRPGDAQAAGALLAAAEAAYSLLSSGSSIRQQEEQKAVALLQQWRTGQGPPPPLARVAIALASVAAEFAQTNPALFAKGEKGEKLIRIAAQQIQVMLPDPDSREQWKDVDWNRYYFAERTLSILLQAGLRTVTADPALLSSEAHVQALVTATADPLLAAFDGTPRDPLDLMRIQDALLGPVAEAALKSVAQNQRQFLGDRFAPEKAAGALTASALTVIRERGLRNSFDDTTLLALVSAGLGVAASRPELFLDDKGRPKDQFAKDLLSNVCAAVQQLTRDRKLADLDGFGVDIAVVVLGVVGEHASGLIAPQNTWEKIAAEAVTSVADGLAEGLKVQGLKAFEQLFTRAQATELIRIVLAEMARTPGLLTGEDASAEVKQLVSALAAAMAADKALLLSPTDWHTIAAVAAEEAARNPARLFRLDSGSPQAQLGTKIITSILTAAAEGFRRSGRPGGAVSFGEVLSEAVQTALRAASGNLEGAARAVGLITAAGGQPLDNLGLLVTTLNELVADDPKQVGWREWRWLFRSLVIDAIDQGEGFKITRQRLLDLLSTTPASGLAAA